MCDLLSTLFPAFRCLQNCSKIDAVNIGENHERELHITLYINPLPALSFLSST